VNSITRITKQGHRFLFRYHARELWNVELACLCKESNPLVEWSRFDSDIVMQWADALVDKHGASVTDATPEPVAESFIQRMWRKFAGKV
jgi:hypothetical protein